jgi:cellulose synthase/poly-beta-1,6-N-acetylglucosamine synthase-like glycosyltransferase
MIEILRFIVTFFNYFVLIYFFMISSIYCLLFIISLKKILQLQEMLFYSDPDRIFRSINYKSISIIAPAYNEENSIVDSIQSLLQLEYPDYQVIVVNDGSKDNTLKKVIDHYSMKLVPFEALGELSTKPINGLYMSPKYPSLLLIDKLNGGKADAINAGINFAKNSIVMVIDADSILDRDCLLKITRPFMEDKNVVAVGGIIRVVNGSEVKKGFILNVGLPKTWLGKFQVVEYLRAFLFGRTGFDSINGILIISGALMCLSKDAVIKVGGFLTGSIGEDMEIITRMQRILRLENPDTKIVSIPDPVCWTEAPENLKILRRQRSRWQKGTVECILAHKEMLFNPKYGLLGIVVFPYFLLFELLGPIIEVIGYFFFAFSLIFGFIDTSFALLFLCIVILFGIIISVFSVILEELTFRKYPKISHLLVLFLAAILENFGYRQLTSYWRFKGMLDYVFGKRVWEKMEKKGFKK